MIAKAACSITRRALLKSAAAVGGGAAAGALRGPIGGARAASGLSTPIDAKDMVVAFGHVGPISDGGWTTSHHVGKLAVEKAFPGVKTLEVESVPFSAEAGRIFTQFVRQGAKMVFVTSGYSDLLGDVAKKFPDVAFLECNGDVKTPNHISYYIAHWSPAYLIGMAAGLITKSNQLGYVASFPTTGVKSDVNAFQLGARSVNPQARTQVVAINSWFDPQGAAQAGSALIDKGCDVLFGIMDEAAYLQVAEKRGKWAAMWNTDMRQYGPNAYVSSLMLDWNAYYVSEVGKRIKGSWSGDRIDILPLGAGTDRDAWGAKVPGEVAAKVDEMRQRMLKGFNPFVGPLKDTAGNVKVREGDAMNDMMLYSWDWVVEGVSGMS
jgi:basic membrane lipoprotein Med (substrate-binding protein (PBP1-ABC) superfamily)